MKRFVSVSNKQERSIYSIKSVQQNKIFQIHKYLFVSVLSLARFCLSTQCLREVPFDSFEVAKAAHSVCCMK